MPVCFVCNNSVPSISALNLHFKLKHRLNENSTYRCREVNCFRDFVNLKSFKNHLRSKHSSSIYTNDIKVQSNANFSTITIDSTFTNSNDSNEVIGKTEQCDYSVMNDFKRILYDQTMSFIAKLYNSPLLPRNHVQEVLDGIKDYLASGFVLLLKNYVLKIIDTCNVDSQIVSDISFMFDNLIGPLENFETEYLRFKEFEKSNLLIKPVEYIVGTRTESCKTNNGIISLKVVDVTAQFIPLRNVFTEILNMKNLMKDMLQYVECLKNNDNVITNIYQSTYFQTILQNFEKKKLVLPMFMYYDDYESGNPLGSHSGVHKLGAVYVSIATFPPKYRSALDNIFMALLFHSNDRKDFGNAAIFNVLINEFKYLEEHGIIVETTDGPVSVHFVLSLILGDNLGLHSILGFVESFNSNFNCRFCKGDKNLSKILNVEDVTLIRTKENYDADLALDDVSKSGIKELCIFNSLKYMHAVTNYSVDIMHDLFEGVCHYDMLHILKYLIFNVNYFSVETLNSRIEAFSYGYESSNKPPLLSKDFHLKNKISMSATEMLCFVRYFGLLVGDLVRENDEIWKFFLLLREIITLVTTQNITDNICQKLKFIILEHNTRYQNLFKDNLKPKHHHLIHYASIMQQIGPLENISSMRFEAKHRQSKMTANVTCSRRNITKSLAIKHQLKVCYRLLGNEGFKNTDFIGPGLYTSYFDMLENYPNIFPSSFQTGFVPKWVIIGNSKFQQNSAILVGFDEDTLPRFGIIQHIVVNNSKEIGFLYLKLKTVCFNEHIYAYQVEKELDSKFVVYADLYEFPLVLLCKMTDSKLYISMRNPP